MASGSHSRPMSVPPVGAPQAMVLSPDDVQQGNVLWLAPHRETVASLQGRRGVSRQPVLSLVKRMGPEPAFYNHPILVISRPKQSPYSIHFLLLTSFNGKNITKRFTGSAGRAAWPGYLAVFPAADHPLYANGDPKYATLRLEHDNSMKRPGYLQISEVYEMDWRDAQPYWQKQTKSHSRARLDARSLKLVLAGTVRLTGYIPEEQHSSHTLASPRPVIYAPVVRTQTVSRSLNTSPIHAVRDRPPEINSTVRSGPTTATGSRTYFDSCWQNRGPSEREPLLPIHHHPHHERTTTADFNLCALCAWLCVGVGLLIWLGVSLSKQS